MCVNPRPDSPEEEKATAAGLTPQVAQTGGEQFYFGLVVTQGRPAEEPPGLLSAAQAVPGIRPLPADLQRAVARQAEARPDHQPPVARWQRPGNAARENHAPAAPVPHGQFVANELGSSPSRSCGLKTPAAALPADLSRSWPSSIRLTSRRSSNTPSTSSCSPANPFSSRSIPPRNISRSRAEPAAKMGMMGGPQPGVSSNLPKLLDAYGALSTTFPENRRRSRKRHRPAESADPPRRPRRYPTLAQPAQRQLQPEGAPDRPADFHAVRRGRQPFPEARQHAHLHPAH